MANTPNLNLEEPAHGSANWDTPLNSNFSLIDAGVLLNAPLANQTIANGHNLTNDSQGGFVVSDSANTDATLTMSMSSFSAAQGAIAYREAGASIFTRVNFNPSGAISLNPKAAGADDGGNGVVVNNSGLYIAGHFDDGNSLTAANGNAAFAGSGPTGTPILVLGSAGVEGVIETVPQTGPGTYVLRSPNSSVNSVLSLPIGTGTFALEVTAPSTATSAGVAGSIAFDASFFYVCVSTNVWRRVAIAAW